jgi:pyrroloquinoline quinone biosynthesis protein B
VLFKVLGAAAGGGFPQWNCTCRNCRGLRDGTVTALPRLQSSLAVTQDGHDWVLLNASPDLRHAVERHLRPFQGEGVRWHPIRAVVLTDAQLDHATGLLPLRESREPLDIYCTARVEDDLRRGFPVLEMLGSYCGVRVHRLPIDGEAVAVSGLPGVRLTAIPVAGKAPPYSAHRNYEEPGDNVALWIEDGRMGRAALYAPGMARLEEPVAARLAQADAAFLDGSFWSEDEMERSGCGHKRASDMGHCPLGGESGLLAQLGRFPKPRKLFVHINNTNPILDDESPECAAALAAGCEVARDGREIML